MDFYLRLAVGGGGLVSRQTAFIIMTSAASVRIYALKTRRERKEKEGHCK
jgi:hypothetical protein